MLCKHVVSKRLQTDSLPPERIKPSEKLILTEYAALQAEPICPSTYSTWCQFTPSPGFTEFSSAGPTYVLHRRIIVIIL
ncbi:hypothetical protein C7433_1011297 [Pantoea sp. PNA 03-3]|nr:hypothetical protein C7433_1011297 [Pantoea sp. PNA 03-3]